MLAALLALTLTAQLTVDSSLRFEAPDGGWQDGGATVQVPVGPEGGAVRFRATAGKEALERWFVLEPKGQYRVTPSPCAGIALKGLAAGRPPYLQLDLSRLKKETFPWRLLDPQGKTLSELSGADLGDAVPAAVDARCPELGARIHVVDSAGKTRFLETLALPDERVTRVTLLPGGGFEATTSSAQPLYFQQETARVDPVTLCGLTVTGKPYLVIHEHGGAAAQVSFAVFEVKNPGPAVRTLEAKDVRLMTESGEQPLKLTGLSLAADDSKHSDAGSPGPSVKLPTGTRVLRVWFEPKGVYLASINSFFRFAVQLACEKERATVTVPLRVMREDR